VLIATPALALDRNAFSFPRYDLQLTFDPPQQALTVEGTVELRNISSQPQSEAALQISSSLHWLSVLAAGAPIEWLAQSYTSDIDHTGQLSEAIVKFDTPLAPGATLLLNVRYSGTVLRDATRLERIGTPHEIALRSDWDEIGDRFTALRGAGFVVWYPVSMDAANLSQGNELFETLRAWRERQSSSLLRVQLSRVPPAEGDNEAFTFVGNGTGAASGYSLTQEFRGVEPVLVLLDNPAETTDRPRVAAYYTAAHTDAARDYMAAVESIIPTLEEWFGTPRSKVVLVELTDPDALPYDAGSYYFVPMRSVPHAAAEVALARPVAHAMLESPRPWIRDGLANFAQAIIREHQAGRRAALDYLGQFSSSLAVAEAQSHSAPAPGSAPASATGSAHASAAGSAALPDSAASANAPQPLITTADEIFFRTKAAYVWWMLRDQLGDRPLQSALAAYRAADDRDTGYMQRLIEQQFSPHRDLESFFDDWVYRDRGLPQLRIVSTDVRNTLGGQTVTAVTVENLGEAGCEVPVVVRSASAEGRERLLVPAKSKATVRVSLTGVPTEAEVNDGSVPEADHRDHVSAVASPPPGRP
jgi:hypothetical protein